ncbi:protein translocase subunit SecF [Halovenus marina]|uniref:protein translocase subunit SecF n=1 Tax=Halovenus marina TaxID=3396621 RepID=UPI003F56604D
MSRRVQIDDLPYEEYSNRQLAAVPLAILGIALLVLLGAYFMTGSPVDLGLAFTGGTEIRVEADVGSGAIQDQFESAELSVESVQSVGLGQSDEYLVTTQETGADAISEFERVAEGAGYDVLSTEIRSATFGSDSQRQALIGVVIAFIGMSLLVALMFRSFIPSLAIVASAFSDLMIPLALMSLMGIELGLGTVAALLMLIGYSVDSDILLNNHVLKRHGGFYESASRAMRTGISMTVTSIAAMVVMYLMARLFGIPLLPQIALVLVFGLVADLVNTYMMNISLLRWYKYEGVNR